MTAPTPYQPAPSPVAQPPRNGLGTAGFVLGLVGLIFSPIPIIGLVAWPLVIIGLVLSFLGLGRANKGVATNKGLAIAGIVLSAIGLVVCVIWVAAFSKVATDAANSLPTAPPALTGAPAAAQPGTGGDPAAAKHTVVYKVTGTGKAGNITFTTDGMTTTSQESNVKLPWEKTIELPGDQPLQLVSILAQGSGSGNLKVTIEVDGKVFKEATAQGYGVATANGDIGTLRN
ncbi:DUF4190 domain-containing protein [Amycolatopsis sp. WQ 127309]|uniref:DUF4190 domain-containing protein n=1 Tax=Amycolatopsis sp. WQ 127309 TaxID=2932773 RepID=UPI001FF5932F|nr:DUF4190 domain-containing protein [Amycolatopsis sp. WQ 127309]UOZ04285.1 DUF4190 domain-containing protein [Amycolatopsis sp. WQ 127309]